MPSMSRLRRVAAKTDGLMQQAASRHLGGAKSRELQALITAQRRLIKRREAQGKRLTALKKRILSPWK